MTETIEVLQHEIVCDGGGGPLGHPRIYLHLDPHLGERAICPYCSRTYVLKQPHSGQAA